MTRMAMTSYDQLIRLKVTSICLLAKRIAHHLLSFHRRSQIIPNIKLTATASTSNTRNLVRGPRADIKVT
jgi:hypothetical protein